jgi:hypothetical protein
VDDPRKRNILIGIGVVVVLVAGVLIGALAQGDDDASDATTTTTSTTVATTTSSSSTTSTEPPTTTTVAPADLAASVYPALTGGARFSDPDALVRAFATELLGFDTDLAVQVSPEPGTVLIHPAHGTQATVVAVRQLPDDTWIVTGASTNTIRLDTPTAGSAIRSPQALAGAASAFEGHVDVMLYVDGEAAPLATTAVTGRGDGQLGDFTGQLRFAPPPAGTRGILVLASPNGDDGTTVSAVAIRVRF